MPPVWTYRIRAPLREAEQRVREALSKEGFGILTEVDVAATLHAKLGLATRPYRILGACNPGIAHRALQAEPRVGAFLPCGLALYEELDGTTTVCLQNPAMIAELFLGEEVAAAAALATDKLTAALASIGSEE